jgi:DNA-binding NarL/FixJ family response regulator
MIKVLVCDDETLVRQGLIAILSNESGIKIVGEAADGREAIEKTGTLAPDVVLMDIRMPGLDGVEATRAIANQYPRTRVIILSTYDYEEYILEGIRAGALGYVLKDTTSSDLARTIQRVHRGERFIQSAVAGKILFEMARPRTQPQSALLNDSDNLTEREVAIITRLARGLSNREVGAELNLSEGTVKNYVTGILAKLQVSNRVQAINAARKQRII